VAKAEALSKENNQWSCQTEQQDSTDLGSAACCTKTWC